MFIKSKSGMTLIEIVVALGIFGLLGTVFASSFVEVFKAQKMVETKDRANDFASAMGRFLYKDSSCQSSLIGTNLPRGTTKANLTIRDFVGFGNGGVDGATTMNIKKGTIIDTVMRVKTLTIQDAGISPMVILSDGTDYNRLNARIELNMEILNKGQWKELPPRFFEIPVFTNIGGRRIERCSVEMQMADACSILGSTLGSNGQCNPQTQCIMQGHFIRSTCSPNTGSCPPSEKNIYTNRLKCPKKSAASQSGKFNYSYTESCGKKCTRTIRVTQEFYVCMKCT